MNLRLQRYLRTRSAGTSWQLEGSKRNDFAGAVIIPALGERQSLPFTLDSLAANPAAELARTLVLIVVNNRTDAGSAVRRDNQTTLDWLEAQHYPYLGLAWVDASSAGRELPENEGVGLARKIGFDLALPRLDWSANPVLISLDADSLVDGNYLPAIFAHFRSSRIAGATLPFRHQAGESPEQEAAIRRYELYLRSYLFGLQRAGSPYAYPTVGSAFACTAAGYIAAGGMNRRSAAEDFYFLQQLAKTSGVEMLKGTLVRPSPRLSTRVPFGTGQAVQTQLEGKIAPFRFCPAEGFSLLRNWLVLVAQHWDQTAARVLEQAAEQSAMLVDFLNQFDFTRQWGKLQSNHRERKQFIRAFHGWFDGLRTRQLLGCWAKPGSPAEELELVRELLEWGGLPAADTLTAQLRELEELQC